MAPRVQILFLDHFFLHFVLIKWIVLTNWLVDRFLFIFGFFCSKVPILWNYIRSFPFSFFSKRIVLTNWLHACTTQITSYIWHFLYLAKCLLLWNYITSFFLSFFLSNRIVLTNWLHACKQKKIWQHCTKTHLECIKQECHLPGEQRTFFWWDRQRHQKFSSYIS